MPGLRSEVRATRDGAASQRPSVSELVSRALETVRDPELDEPITSLGFVASCTVSADGDAQVRLRLPTYFCAPNFAFLMVADAYDAVSAMPGVRTTEIVLEDHFAAEAINGGVAARAGFAQSFDGEAVGELHQLRADFLRKAVLAGTDLVCRPLAAAGIGPPDLAALTLGQTPPSRDRPGNSLLMQCMSSPARQARHSPQVGVGCRITVSPTATFVTAEPASCTQPAFSWPRM